MKLSFSSKGEFEGALDWLNRISKANPTSALKDIGNSGSKSLSSNTPRDTGATASGWDYKVTSTKGNSEIAWINKAHPGTNVNVAKLIDQGHGTKNGGYVPPKPYIKKSMDSVFKTAGDKLVKELVK